MSLKPPCARSGGHLTFTLFPPVLRSTESSSLSGHSGFGGATKTFTGAEGSDQSDQHTPSDMRTEVWYHAPYSSGTPFGSTRLTECRVMCVASWTVVVPKRSASALS